MTTRAHDPTATRAQRQAEEEARREEEELPDYYFVDGDGVQHGPVTVSQMKVSVALPRLLSSPAPLLPQHSTSSQIA